MKLDSAALDAYDARVEQLSALGSVAENLIAELLRASGIQPHSVTHRVKSKRSYRRKLSEKGESYASIEDMHDLLGVRVITYFKDDVDAVARVVEDEFTIDEQNSVDKRALLDPDRFGYLSLHYVCSMSPARSRLTEHVRFAGLVFEVQVRSILQHAWAEIEHDRGYHTERALPSGFRRRFSQLAGVLELADQEFQAIRGELDEYREAVGKDPITGTGIDRDSVLAFIRSDPLVARVDERLFGRYGDPIDVSEVVAGRHAERLQGIGLSTMAELRELLRDRTAVMERFVEAWLAGRTFEGPSTRGISLMYLWYVLLAERLDDRELLAVIEAQRFDPSEVNTIAADVRRAYEAATAA